MLHKITVKLFLYILATVMALLSIIPALTNATKNSTILGYPRRYYFYESSATSDYQSHLFSITNFLINLVCAAVLAVILLGVLKFVEHITRDSK